MTGKRILIVDDEESLRRVTQLRLQQAGYEASTAADGDEALAFLQRHPQDLVLTDLRMPGMSGLDLLKRIRQDYPEIIVIVVTAFGTIESAVEAMKHGAFDYIIKPVNSDALRIILARALEHHELRREVQSLRTAIDRKFGFESIIGRSKALLSTLENAARAAQSASTVLVRGETGTGKELLAKAIHFNSPRRDRPMIVINCGAIPRELLESELFGHTRGSFTGAVVAKQGKIEMADQGTLFLDEIGEMPLELQVKLLRLIQEREIEKIGATQPVKVDVRIIAATHRNLQAMVENGTFREDLYYRLAVIPLELPPLRERPDDVPELVAMFFHKFKQRLERPDLILPQTLLPHFSTYRWPGNVRELENIVERLVVLSPGPEITIADLPEDLRRQRDPLEAIQLELPPQGISLEAVEKELVLRALQKCNWNQTKAADYLDISRKVLIYRMEKFGLKKD
ncbi:sigma-54-dependent transcriptional regulator [Paludibaculum fermentans]|uniref:Sigma-54-dependent Fis family transcriptional regulator n=1 Tax=Paludibaculum fermentans TaxID=1473598 RepID=A0A7S7SKD6_PALFE|nr:sigma-54 dependent transcriptional regulator [Paludibaculum fermentans]QOY87653.1 sigma-54-dependent Fis family transcriptional regulator [Paludibaculum fermentans]